MKKLWAAALLSVILFSCKREHIDPNLPAANGIPLTLNVDQFHPGNAIPQDFEGLSFETQILAKNPEYLDPNNTVLIQLLKNLGPGLLRIGGDTSDETDWTGKPRDANTTDEELSTTDVDRLADFSKASGWPVLFGLNLGNNNVAAAANEAGYAYKMLGNNLYGFQAGNEPDIYHMFGLRSPDYDINDYYSDWDIYFSAIRSAVPQAAFAGPDVANNTDWIDSFAAHKKDKVKFIDGHYYITGPASKPSINYHNLLDPNYFLGYYLQKINNAASGANLPYRITECNSIYGGGKAGASDVFAASLWSLDFMWTVAQNKGQGVNFHGGKLVYSPITMTNGVVSASPVYYGMLAFKYSNNNARIIPAGIVQSGYNCSAYACVNSDNTYSFTLINKEEAKDFSINIKLNKTAGVIDILRLKAPSVTSTVETTFGGSRVNGDGTFKTTVTEHYTINQKNFNVNVPAGSAAIITVH
jgi:hypothetical protein